MKRHGLKTRIIVQLLFAQIIALSFTCLVYLGLLNFSITIAKYYYLILFLVTSLFVFWLILSETIKDIHQLNQALKDLSLHQYDIRLQLDHNDELQTMANHINQVANDLKTSETIQKEIKENEMKHYKQRQEEDAIRHELMTSIAHDIRTPMTSMMGYLQLLDTNHQLSEDEKAKYIHMTLDKSKRLNQLMNDFFDFSAFSSNEITIEKKPVNLSLLLQMISEEFYIEFEKRQLSIDLKLPENTLFVLGDVNLLVRVFDNLLSNALKYAYTNSVVEIEAIEMEKEIQIKVTNEADELSFETLNRLFDQFYRSDASRTSSIGGSGLGLAIAKRIVALHDGDIYASSINHHVAFIVTLKK